MVEKSAKGSISAEATQEYQYYVSILHEIAGAPHENMNRLILSSYELSESTLRRLRHHLTEKWSITDRLDFLNKLTGVNFIQRSVYIYEKAYELLKTKLFATN